MGWFNEARITFVERGYSKERRRIEREISNLTKEKTRTEIESFLNLLETYPSDVVALKTVFVDFFDGIEEKIKVARNYAILAHFEQEYIDAQREIQELLPVESVGFFASFKRGRVDTLYKKNRLEILKKMVEEYRSTPRELLYELYERKQNQWGLRSTGYKRDEYFYPKLKDLLSSVELEEVRGFRASFEKLGIKFYVAFDEVKFFEHWAFFEYNKEFVAELLLKKLSKIKRQESERNLRALAAEKTDRQRTVAQTHRKKEGYKDQISKYKLCPYCHGRLGGFAGKSAAHLDHIYPTSKGGLSTIQNLVYICQKCNLAKSNMTLSAFIKQAGLDQQKIHHALDVLEKDY